MLRNLVKNPTRALREFNRLARMAPGAAIMLPIDMIRVALGQGSRRNEGKYEGKRSQVVHTSTSPKERHSLA